MITTYLVRLSLDYKSYSLSYFDKRRTEKCLPCLATVVQGGRMGDEKGADREEHPARSHAVCNTAQYTLVTR